MNPSCAQARCGGWYRGNRANRPDLVFASFQCTLKVFKPNRLDWQRTMGRVVTGVTLQTFPQAVQQAGLKPGQRFSVIVEDEGMSREDVLARIDAVSKAIDERLAADGIVTEAEKEALVQSIMDE